MKKSWLYLAVLTLSACGFHLKGNYAFDHLPVKNWSIAGAELQKPLETALRYASGNVVADNEATAQLRVLSIDTKRDIYTITRAAKLNEYLLSMRVTAQAYKNGKAWGKPLVANVRRNMPYSDTQVLGKADEEGTLWQEMRQDAASQIVRQLSFIDHENHMGGVVK